MEKVLLIIIALSGLSAVSSHAERQYHFVYEAKNMSEAQRYCREKHTDLATVDSMEVVELLNNMAGHNKQSAWIGLYHATGSWRWSLSDTSFYKPGETEFRRWWVGGPNNSSWKKCSIISSNDGNWDDLVCDILLSAVCCDVTGTNVTFVSTEGLMTWPEAQSYCREHHTDLASVRNQTENQQIVELLHERGDYWIGLYRDSWKWSDGSPSSFRYWREKEPNCRDPNVCVAADFYNSGKWEDLDCGVMKPFICYKKNVPVSMQVIKVRVPKPNSGVDLNDPAFLEEMLVQAKKNLRAQGLDDNIKLTWRKQPDGKVFQKEQNLRPNERNREETRMEKVLLIIIALSGLSAVSSHAERQYHFVYEAKSMPEAQRYCREKHTDLATVDSMEVVELLNNMAGQYKQSAWIGLNDDRVTWRWSLSDPSFYKLGETKFRRWHTGQPSSYESEQCTFMLNGAWFGDPCQKRNYLRAVCCDVTGTDATFVLINSTRTWPEAQSYCREHHTDLASVRNQTENQQIAGLIPSGVSYWIGLYKESWKWSDGSPFSFKYWAGGKPGLTGIKRVCVAAAFKESGRWFDYKCAEKKPFICYKNVPVSMQVIKVRVQKPNSGVDLNDPAFLEEMLVQAKKNLRAQGLDDNIKLTWRKQPDGKVFQKEQKKKDEL
ncbi:macrophage mannose receptor 1-like [Eleginops maclovinus]|uniref:macrophage mannose receptor 1-like n=1 Tax=Eleginops maclovinus TaxID=56733 RepID=UPI003080A244